MGRTLAELAPNVMSSGKLLMLSAHTRGYLATNCITFKAPAESFHTTDALGVSPMAATCLVKYFMSAFVGVEYRILKKQRSKPMETLPHHKYIHVYICHFIISIGGGD